MNIADELKEQFLLPLSLLHGFLSSLQSYFMFKHYIDLLSVEKASVPASVANTDSTMSSNTPRESRPITTLFLLTAVSFVLSFHQCARCTTTTTTQRSDTTTVANLSVLSTSSLSFFSYFCLLFLSQ